MIQQVEAGDPVVLPFPGSVSQFATLVEIGGALEGMVRLALVQADLGAPAHVGVRGPVDHEQGVFDAPGKEDEIRRFLELGVPKTAIAKITGVARPTLYSFMSTQGLRPGR